MSKIIGNRDGVNNRNETYNIGSRKNVVRKQAVAEVDKGLHKGYHIYKLNGKKYIRDNPDKSKSDNVNRT
jgi:hypothetical protein